MSTARLSVGDHVIEPVLDSASRGDPTRIFPGSSLAAWRAVPGALQPDGTLELSIGAFLVRTGGRVVLVDLGVGPTGWRAPSGAAVPPGHLATNLAAAGVVPGDVTDVVLTHTHPDHVGWASVDGRAAFPRATYRCHRADWAHFVEGDGDPTVRRLLAPVADRVEAWEGDGTLFPGVDLLAAPGHTPGSTVVVLSGADGARAVLLGDVAHCPVELLDDDWATIGDVDPALARRTRARFAAELASGDAHVSAAHFPELRFGRLVAARDSRRSWAFTS